MLTESEDERMRATGPVRTVSLPCLGVNRYHRMAVHLWGPGDDAAPTVVCLHGLTRQGRDFDVLAAALAARGWRVACPDIVGRGGSDWLTDPSGYVVPAYIRDIATLIAWLRSEAVAIVGTSMGGLIGMGLAASGAPVSRLVLNDVGPEIAANAVARIVAYLAAEPPSFPDLNAARDYLRRVHAPFGPLTEAQWLEMARHSTRPTPEGGFRLHYDPAIAAPMRAQPPLATDLWPMWYGIACPVLVLRGATSDLLTRETAARMAGEGPRARIIDVPDCGHAPALLAADQIEPIVAFLEAAKGPFQDPDISPGPARLPSRRK